LANYPLKSFLVHIGDIGSDPSDSEEVSLQKTLLIYFAGSMALMALLWGLLYFYFGETLAGSIPFSYALISILSLIIFNRTKSFTIFLVSQLVFSLFLPFLLMISLGGFAASGAVVMWSLTSPLGALVLKGRIEAMRWFIAFLALVIISAFLEGMYTYGNSLKEGVINGFFAMNIIGTSLTSFIIVRYFVGEKNLALTLLGKRNEWIKNVFSAYVSPNLVDHLIANASDLNLGGERRECSFIFTDLVGFTTLVEHSDPATLVTSLNEYFEGMIAIVFQHEGTVSKIVGDAIAVMFSAPLVQEDHASRAIACALDLDIYAQKFAAEKQKQGMDLGRTRIGVNTGSVILCSIGGKNQLDYRALGDAINTAARLESANKYLGTRVCISETTVSQCSNFLGRPIGSLLLKGKTKPVTTFEPLTQTDMELESTGEYLKVYKEMEQKSDHALEALKNLVKKYPNDKLAARHLQRYISGETGSDVVLPWK